MPRHRKAATTVLGEHLDKGAARLGSLKQLQAALADAGAAVTIRTIHGWRFGEYWPDVTQHDAIAKVCRLMVEEIRPMLSRAPSPPEGVEIDPSEHQPNQMDAEISAQFWQLNIQRDWADLTRASKCLLVIKTDPRGAGSSYDIVLVEKDPAQLSVGRAFDEHGHIRFVLYSNSNDKIFVGRRQDKESSTVHGYLIESEPLVGVDLLFWNGHICDLNEFFPNAPDPLRKELRSVILDILREQDWTKPLPERLLNHFEASVKVEANTHSYFEVDGNHVEIETPATLFSSVVPPIIRIKSAGLQSDVPRKPWYRFGAGIKR
jgi:hypothetical protein